MSQPARAAVDEKDNAILLDVVSPGGLVVENFVDVLDFQKMIAGSQGSQLRRPALFRALADRERIRARDAAALFRLVQIRFRSHSVLDRPPRPFFENAIEIRG